MSSTHLGTLRGSRCADTGWSKDPAPPALPPLQLHPQTASCTDFNPTCTSPCRVMITCNSGHFSALLASAGLHKVQEREGSSGEYVHLFDTCSPSHSLLTHISSSCPSLSTFASSSSHFKSGRIPGTRFFLGLLSNCVIFTYERKGTFMHAHGYSA